MPRALEPIRRMRGGAQSHLMRCSDGHYYVVKPQNNPQAPQGARILVNEMLGTRLAARMGLPVPPCAVIEVTQELIDLSSDLRIQLGGSSVPWRAGFQFGSRFPGDPSRTAVYDLLPEEQLRQVENLDDFAGALVLDKYSCNVNGRQAIFVPSDNGISYRALFLDQGFFFGAGEWRFPDAALRGLYPRHIVYRNVRGMDSFEPYLARIEKLFTSDAIGAIASEIPPDWFKGDTEALEQLIEQLVSRRRDVRRLLLDAKNSQRQPFGSWKE